MSSAYTKVREAVEFALIKANELGAAVGTFVDMEKVGALNKY